MRQRREHAIRKEHFAFLQPFHTIADTFVTQAIQCNQLDEQAEEQMRRPEDAVRSLAASSSADPRHSKYHLSLLRRTVAAIDGAIPGSALRHERRVHALQLCMSCISAGVSRLRAHAAIAMPYPCSVCVGI
jgi:hypothetical protein